MVSVASKHGIVLDSKRSCLLATVACEHHAVGYVMLVGKVAIRHEDGGETPQENILKSLKEPSQPVEKFSPTNYLPFTHITLPLHLAMTTCHTATPVLQSTIVTSPEPP